MRNQVFGGNGEGETPVPIPNTEVKPFSADGTAREAVWESRSPPKNFLNPEPLGGSGFFYETRDYVPRVRLFAD